MTEGFIFDRLTVQVERVHVVIAINEDDPENRRREFDASVTLSCKLTPIESEQIIQAIEANHRGFLGTIPTAAKPVVFDTEFAAHRVHFRRSTSKVCTLDPCTVLGFRVHPDGAAYAWTFRVKARVTPKTLAALHGEWLTGNTAIEITKGELLAGEEAEAEAIGEPA